MRLVPVLSALAMVSLGFVLGFSFPASMTPNLQCGVLPWSGSTNSSSSESFLGRMWAPLLLRNSSSISNATTRIVNVARRPEGAGRLPPGIMVLESDLHLRRLWGSPRQDAPVKKYLLTMAVGHKERVNVNATVHKFLDKFDVVMFHYDGHTTEWDDEFQWSKEAVHVSARKQTKWWFAKRFLHPSIVAPYDYVFLWDEDLGVENFNAEAYIDIVKKHGLEISQPGLDSTKGKSAYKVSVKRNSGEMHKTDAGGKWCPDVHKRPCSGFVEVMAPVFSRDAWRCVWHMIQNDLVHGWGLDYNFWRCVDDPEEQFGIVDAQYVVHHGVPTLKDQVNGEKQGSRAKIKDRQYEEWHAFDSRLDNADKELANSTARSSSQP
ncbi:hypothetical protein ACQJBY_063037 [Aegilops geniculata]